MLKSRFRNTYQEIRRRSPQHSSGY